MGERKDTCSCHNSITQALQQETQVYMEGLIDVGESPLIQPQIPINAESETR